MEWKYVKPLKKEDEVLRFLQKYNIVLPQKLIKCIEEYNGGRPSIKLFDTDKAKEYVFKALLSYNEEDTENIYKIYPGEFADTMLYPIGTDASGNFVCFDRKNEKYVLWKHESNKQELIIFGAQLKL